MDKEGGEWAIANATRVNSNRRIIMKNDTRDSRLERYEGERIRSGGKLRESLAFMYSEQEYCTLVLERHTTMNARLWSLS